MAYSCFYCTHAVEPDYRDVENLERFLTPRKKILSREKSGVCAKHQRKLSKQVKYARYLALLPYTSLQTHKLDK